MFPSFKKGVTGEFRVNATSYPKTPIVFQQSTNDYTLYLADNAGKFK
jgi:hypothetical protein